MLKCEESEVKEAANKLLKTLHSKEKEKSNTQKTNKEN